MASRVRFNPELAADSARKREGCSEAQRNLLLSFLPYLGTPLVGASVEADTRSLVEDGLAFFESLIGPWELAWGPAVFQIVPGSVAANTMFVAEHRETGELFVSIAGTNPFSAYAWFVEDFFVSQTQRWQYGEAPREAEISMGTQRGLLALQSMVPILSPGANKSLQGFIEAHFSTEDAPTQITISGHSLGGVLAPTLALWLLDTREKWDLHDRASIHVCAFAGPSPGNEAFARYIEERFENNLVRFANPYDVVTHAWNVDELAEVKALYTPEIARDALWDNAVDAAISATQGIRYQHIGRKPTILKGAINRDLVLSFAPDVINYASQVLYQHTIAYFELIGLPYPEADCSALQSLAHEMQPVAEEILEHAGASRLVALPLAAAARAVAEVYARLPRTA